MEHRVSCSDIDLVLFIVCRSLYLERVYLTILSVYLLLLGQELLDKQLEKWTLLIRYAGLTSYDQFSIVSTILAPGTNT